MPTRSLVERGYLREPLAPVDVSLGPLGASRWRVRRTRSGYVNSARSRLPRFIEENLQPQAYLTSVTPHTPRFPLPPIPAALYAE